LEKKLQKLKGVGPVVTNIFLRELRGTWPKVRPKPSGLALEVGMRLGLRAVEPFESALVRLKLEYCKRKKCGECPVGVRCKKARKEIKLSKRSAAAHRPTHS
jgi:hypothetical protein